MQTQAATLLNLHPRTQGTASDAARTGAPGSTGIHALLGFTVCKKTSSQDAPAFTQAAATRTHRTGARCGHATSDGRPARQPRPPPARQPHGACEPPPTWNRRRWADPLGPEPIQHYGGCSPLCLLHIHATPRRSMSRVPLRPQRRGARQGPQIHFGFAHSTRDWGLTTHGRQPLAHQVRPKGGVWPTGHGAGGGEKVQMNYPKNAVQKNAKKSANMCKKVQKNATIKMQ